VLEFRPGPPWGNLLADENKRRGRPKFNALAVGSHKTLHTKTPIDSPCKIFQVKNVNGGEGSADARPHVVPRPEECEGARPQGGGAVPGAHQAASILHTHKVRTTLKTLFFLTLFLGDFHYFIVTPHWMCTNVRRSLRFSSSLLLSEGTPRVPKPGIEPRTYRLAGRLANH